MCFQASIQPGGTVSFEHRNIQGLNRSILGSVTTSNFLNPQVNLPYDALLGLVAESQKNIKHKMQHFFFSCFLKFLSSQMGFILVLF